MQKSFFLKIVSWTSPESRRKEPHCKKALLMCSDTDHQFIENSLRFQVYSLSLQPWFAVLKLMFHLIFLSLSLYFLLKVLKCFMASVKLIIKPKSETTRHKTSDIIYYIIQSWKVLSPPPQV